MSFHAKWQPYFFLIVVLVLAFNLAYTRVINVGNIGASLLASPIPTLTPTPRPSMSDEIKAGIQLLKLSPPLLYETSGKKLSGNLVRKQVALAVLDKNTGEIFEKRVWVKEQDIKNYKKTGTINLQPADPSKPLDIEVQWWNSFNSFYFIHPVKSGGAGAEQFDGVENRPELIVIADKYLLPSQNLLNLPEKSPGKYTDIIYAPYSKSLHLPELIEAGKNYLEKNIDRAYADLESMKVLSRSSSGAVIITGISKDFIRNIILVEHVDPNSFSIATDGGQELTERTLVLIGANQESAYRYTGSSAGASGLAQFIGSTYKTVVSSYPEAKLLKDYSLGMADHVNAIKAMVLYFDSRKKEISNKVTRQSVLQSLGITEEMLAATYNGGGAKVVSSVNKFGLAWMSSQLNLPSSKRIFKKETIDYIKKFQSIKGLNLFASLTND